MAFRTEYQAEREDQQRITGVTLEDYQRGLREEAAKKLAQSQCIEAEREHQRQQQRIHAIKSMTVSELVKELIIKAPQSLSRDKNEFLRTGKASDNLKQWVQGELGDQRTN